MPQRTATRDIYVDANGLRHHLLARGEPGQPVVMLVHGLAGQAHDFDHAARRLAEGSHIYAMDVRGRGESEWGPADQYTFEHYVDDLEAVRQALGLQQMTLVGTWMGGLISIQYAARYPENIRGLVLNDIGPEVRPEGRERLEGYLGGSPDAFPDTKAVVEYFRTHYGPMLAHLDKQQLAEFAQWHVRRNDMGLYSWKSDPAIRRSVTPQPAMPHWDAFRKVSCPVLVIRGVDSDLLAPETAAEMCRERPGCSVVDISGATHAPTLMSAEAIAAIESFLAR